MVRFVVSAEQLRDVLLDVVAPVVSSRSFRSSYENIRFAFRQGELEMLGGDGEQFVRAVVPVDCDVGEEVVMLVPGKLLVKLWKMLSGEVVVSCEGSSLILENAGGRYELRTLPPEEYVGLPSFPEGQVKLEGKALAAALGRVVHFVDEAGYGGPLEGVLLEVGEEGVTVVATDGYRMAVERIECSGVPQGTKLELVVPDSVAKTVARLEMSGVALGWNENYVSFAADGVTVLGWLVERKYPNRGKYPNWREIVEKVVRRYRAVVDRKALSDALRRVALFAGSRERVVLEFTGSILQLKARDDGSWGQETVACEFEGAESAWVALSAEYLDDILGVLRDEERVVLWMGDPKHPVVWEPENASEAGKPSSRMYIVAPMR